MVNCELRRANTRINPCVIEYDDIHQFNNHQIHLVVECRPLRGSASLRGVLDSLGIKLCGTLRTLR